jgi:hypothetical protein
MAFALPQIEQTCHIGNLCKFCLKNVARERFRDDWAIYLLEKGEGSVRVWQLLRMFCEWEEEVWSDSDGFWVGMIEGSWGRYQCYNNLILGDHIVGINWSSLWQKWMKRRLVFLPHCWMLLLAWGSFLLESLDFRPSESCNRSKNSLKIDVSKSTQGFNNWMHQSYNYLILNFHIVGISKSSEKVNNSWRSNRTYSFASNAQQFTPGLQNPMRTCEVEGNRTLVSFPLEEITINFHRNGFRMVHGFEIISLRNHSRVNIFILMWKQLEIFNDLWEISYLNWQRSSTRSRGVMEDLQGDWSLETWLMDWGAWESRKASDSGATILNHWFSLNELSCFVIMMGWMIIKNVWVLASW